MQPPALPSDYDSSPDRFLTNERVRQYVVGGDVHADVARRLASERAFPVLDVGSGTGALGRCIERGTVVALDRSAALVGLVPPPRVMADATMLPFPAGTFGGVAALWMLYHLPDPAVAVAEARRVLRPGGIFVACAPSRYNEPEFQHLLPDWGKPFSFDAEVAADVVAGVFGDVEVERWDAKLMHLPDREAVQIFFRGWGLSEDHAAQAADGVPVPLDVTKRGALVWGRKR
jgi:SAM-dependent methyltransferase